MAGPGRGGRKAQEQVVGMESTGGLHGQMPLVGETCGL